MLEIPAKKVNKFVNLDVQVLEDPLTSRILTTTWYVLMNVRDANATRSSISTSRATRKTKIFELQSKKRIITLLAIVPAPKSPYKVCMAAFNAFKVSRAPKSLPHESVIVLQIKKRCFNLTIIIDNAVSKMKKLRAFNFPHHAPYYFETAGIWLAQHGLSRDWA